MRSHVLKSRHEELHLRELSQTEVVGRSERRVQPKLMTARSTLERSTAMPDAHRVMRFAPQPVGIVSFTRACGCV